jgi:hypothetical protein
MFCSSAFSVHLLLPWFAVYCTTVSCIQSRGPRWPLQLALCTRPWCWSPGLASSPLVTSIFSSPKSFWARKYFFDILFCSTCNVTCPSQWELDRHNSFKRHLQKMDKAQSSSRSAQLLFIAISSEHDQPRSSTTVQRDFFLRASSFSNID